MATKRRTSSTGMLVGGSEAIKQSRMMPTITLTDKDLPEIKDWKVGQVYHLEIDAEMVRTSKGSLYSEDSSGHEASFKVKKVYTEEQEEKGKK